MGTPIREYITYMNHMTTPLPITEVPKAQSLKTDENAFFVAIPDDNFNQ